MNYGYHDHRRTNKRQLLTQPFLISFVAISKPASKRQRSILEFYLFFISHFASSRHSDGTAIRDGIGNGMGRFTAHQTQLRKQASWEQSPSTALAAIHFVWTYVNLDILFLLHFLAFEEEEIGLGFTPMEDFVPGSYLSSSAVIYHRKHRIFKLAFSCHDSRFTIPRIHTITTYYDSHEWWR